MENPTVEDVQHELTVMVEESIADLGLEEMDEGSVAADLFASLTFMYDSDAALLAEVARREFGFVPGASRPDVVAAFKDVEVEW